MMKRSAVFTLVLTALAGGGCAHRQSASALYADWHTVTTEHFAVHTPLGAGEAEQTAFQLELLHRALVETFFPRATPERLDVLLFRYEDQAGRAREEARAVGPGGGRASGALVLALRDRHRSQRAGTGTDKFTTSWQAAAARELTRRMLDEAIDRPPRWFREGLSRYLATAQVESDVAIFGHRPNDLAWELGRGRAIPLGQLLDAGDAEFSGEWRRDYAASAWGFIHYLLDGQGGKLRPRFDALAAELQRRGPGASGRAAVAAAFPDLPFATLETQVRDYEVEMLGRRATFHPFPVNLQPPATTAGTATRADPERLQALLLGLHHHR